MDQELRLGIVYENNLDTDKFARMFNNKAQSYKFYWFEAILNLVKTEERDFTFEEVIDEMICEAYLMKRPYGHDVMPLGIVQWNAGRIYEKSIYTCRLLIPKESSMQWHMHQSDTYAPQPSSLNPEPSLQMRYLISRKITDGKPTLQKYALQFAVD